MTDCVGFPPFNDPANTGLGDPIPRAGNQVQPQDPPVKGWICPVCQHGVAPKEKICPCAGAKDDTSNQVTRCLYCGQFYKGMHICQMVPHWTSTNTTINWTASQGTLF